MQFYNLRITYPIPAFTPQEGHDYSYGWHALNRSFSPRASRVEAEARTNQIHTPDNRCTLARCCGNRNPISGCYWTLAERDDQRTHRALTAIPGPDQVRRRLTHRRHSCGRRVDYDRFWPTTMDVFEATVRFESRMQGPKQVTNAYLLAIAIHHKGKLAMMDRAILHLAGLEFAKHVELIQ
jgi:predicted nucleic acid-binding protein